jgi:hypothetical protein
MIAPVEKGYDVNEKEAGTMPADHARTIRTLQRFRDAPRAETR